MHVLLDCLETGNWRIKYLNKKWLSINNELITGKYLDALNKDKIRRNLGCHLDQITYKWFNPLKPELKSHLLFAGIISSPFSPRYQDKG